MVQTKKKQQQDPHLGTKIFVIAIILVMLFFTSIVFAGILGIILATEGDTLESGNVALIPLSGVISTTSTSSGIYGGHSTTSADIVKFIKKADEDESIKAIVMEINTPGGSPVATDEIAYALKQTDKPTVAWIREIGASGGYWVATSTDYIIANRMSLTGSVGVIGSYLEFDGLMNDYNVTYRRYVSGHYKDIGSPFKEATDMEQYLFQQKLNILHDYFKMQVQQSRNLSNETMEEVGTGIFFLGAEAYDIGLVDELGGKDTVVMYLNSTYNISADFVRYEKKVELFDDLFGVMERVGIGIGKGIRPGIEEQGVNIRY
jgi:protease-4